MVRKDNIDIGHLILKKSWLVKSIIDWCRAHYIPT